ncbi:translesion error-prone DNA polymerase V autoproteolytic subunit [Shewanella corallii]|uniref:Translesion error-prone DNA polymerase V autoproteolytic subunit n=1 Tax=Shewanella corallii TaxID=560080 RepID=A0ABT0NCE1_9GAMM|nr:translesion error-prone DNA polymerase V autoproteolytic subunit [Shewanella corallii]MCL2916035.1 translesion error-prone DNA polymerase V autoproteolytic subunit [Shewanella corallii]
MRVIPLSASAGISGFESPASEYLQQSLSLDELLVMHPSATFIGRAAGDSMQGAGIYDGDILIVDRHVEVRHQDVIVANYNGEFVCKILDKRNRQLLSASEYYQAVPIQEWDEFSIEGVVVHSVRLHRQCVLLEQ